MWYPGLDNDTEHDRYAPMKPPVAWPETKERCSRLHIDFAGPIEGHMQLVVVD